MHFTKDIRIEATIERLLANIYIGGGQELVFDLDQHKHYAHRCGAEINNARCFSYAAAAATQIHIHARDRPIKQPEYKTLD